MGRRFTFSTTTALLRPCGKLWRTVPASTGRLSDKVLVGVTLKVFSPEFFDSLISLASRGRAHSNSYRRQIHFMSVTLKLILELASARLKYFSLGEFADLALKAS